MVSILLLLVTGLAGGAQGETDGATGTTGDQDPLVDPMGSDREMLLPGAIELIENRTRFSKTWVLENGTYLSRISQTPLHYADAQGAWQDIDTVILPASQLDLDLTDDPSLYGNTRNMLQSLYGLDGRVTIAQDEARAKWTPQRVALIDASDGILGSHTAQGVVPIVDGDQIAWDGLFPQSTDRYTVERGLVKHDLVLHEPLLEPSEGQNADNGSFALQGTLDLSPGLSVFADGEEKTEDFITEGSVLFFNADGSLAFTMGSVYAYDGSGPGTDDQTDSQPSMETLSWIEGRTRVRFTGEGLQVSFEVPSDWIHSEHRVYPVTVDPTWGWDDVDASIYVRQDHGNQDGVSWLYSGATVHWDWGCFCNDGKANRIFLKQDLSPLDNRIISVSQVRMDHYVETVDNVNHAAHLVSFDGWDPATMTWGTQPSASTSLGSMLPSTTGWKAIFPPNAVVEDEISGQHVAKFSGNDQMSYRIFRTTGEFGNSENYMRIYRTGGTAPEWIVHYEVDHLAPSTSVGLSGTSGSNGWYRSSVGVALGCSDSGAGCHRTLYSVNGGSEKNYSGSFTVGGQGTTVVGFRSQDRVLNWETAKTQQIKIDSVAPSTGISLSGTLGSNLWYRSNVGVSLTCSDATSGCVTTQFRVNGGSWQSGTGLTLSTSGSHTVDYRSMDLAGNWEGLRSNTVKIDKVLPSASHSLGGTMGSNGWYRSPVTVSLSATDAHSGVAAVQYRLNGGGWQAYTGSFTVGAQGITTLDYLATDNAGNMRTITGNSFRIDTGVPSTSSSLSGTLGNNGWYRTSVGVSFSCSDATSGCATTQYRVNGGAWQSGSSFTLSTLGVNTIDYRSVDVAGNWESVKSRQVKIDSALPSVSHSLTGTAGTNGWYRSPVTVSLSATDAHSGVAMIQYRLNGGGWQAYTGSFTVGTQGVTTLDYLATDNAGNTRSITGNSFKIDTGLPSTSSSLSGTLGDNGWYRSSVGITFSCSDSVSGCATTEYRVNGGSWQSGSGLTLSTLGINTVDYRSLDAAGNWESIESIQVKIDSALPSISHSLSGTAGTNGWYRSTVTVSLSASDAHSGVATIQYRVNGGSWQPYSDPLTINAQGVFAFDYRAVDNAGNVRTVTGPEIKIDFALPVTDHALSGTLGSNGWYRSSVDIVFSCSDATSGCDTTEYRIDGGAWQEGPGTTLASQGVYVVDYRSTDIAGNIEGINSVEVKIDTSPPVIEGGRSPLANANGWNNEDVTISFTCSDNLSGVGTLTSPQTLTSEGAGQSATGACEDLAGNSATAMVGDINIDKSDPAIALESRTPANVHGWNNDDVIVEWTCSDALSGPLTPTISDTVSGEGAAQSTTGTCEDHAGNTATHTENDIHIDQTPPGIVLDSRTPANANGWNNEDVVIEWTCNDTLSGPLAPGAGTTLTTEGAGQSATGTCEDLAGNSASSTVGGINIDKTSPSLAGDRAPLANVNGWNNEDVTVTFSCSDNLSGVDTVTGPQTFTGEGAGQSATGNCEDFAGNTVSSTVGGINIDKTAPEIVGDRAPLANANGWNNEDVTVSFSCGDNLSGVSAVSGPQTFTNEGTGHSTTGTCEDPAGNTASDTVGDINIDKTSPSISSDRAPLPNPHGWNNEDVTVSFSCSDNLSGVDTVTGPQTLTHDGAGHTATGACEDLAGNSDTEIVENIHIDKSEPVIVFEYRTPANEHGWNNGVVNVFWTCTDSVSGPLEPDQSAWLSTEGAGQSVVGTCYDLADNSASDTVGDIHIDTSAPEIVLDSRTPTNANGWNNEDVVIQWTCSDVLSGPLAPGVGDTLTAEGAGQSAVGTCQDLADNTASDTVNEIHIDKTSPSISSDRTPLANANGWNNEDVTVSFSCSDSLSGVDTVTGPQSFTNEGAGQSVTGSCQDLAENTASDTVADINIDKTSPSISSDRAPLANANGWNNEDVTVTFSCSDSLSGVDTVTGPQSFTNEGTGHSTTGTCDDLAGNSATDTVGDINIDKTSPSISSDRAPLANANGWNNENVTVAFTCADGLSGVDTVSDPTILGSEGADQTVAGDCVDLADNTVTTTVGGIHIDKTAPGISGDRAPLANANGWNNEEVTVTFACVDSLSGVGAVTGPQTFTNETTGQSVTGSCQDLAGNTVSSTVGDINIDKTSPSISSDRTPLANANGWNNEDVTVAFTCADSLSGVDAVTGPQTFTGEGAGQSATGTCEDLAGNTDTATVGDIHIDKTSPSISSDRTPLANANGWNNEDVTVSFSCSDSLSGVDTVTGPQTFTNEGTGHSTTGTCEDLAGNTASSTVGDINIDKTSPSILFGSRTPANANGWNNQDVTAQWACSDDLAGPADTTITVTLGQEGQNQTATGTCEDLAGNAVMDTVGGIHIDKTAPGIVGDRAPLANANGWNNQDVTVTFGCTDTLSGVDTLSDPQTLSEEGAGQSVTGTCEDLAGNNATSTVADINIDKTAPGMEGYRTPLANANGWNNEDVTVSFVCDDLLSGVDTISDPQTLSGEGTDQSATGTCVDNAGNTVATTVGNIHIDKSAPSSDHALSGIEGDDDWFRSTVNVSLMANDTLSGVSHIEYRLHEGPWTPFNGTFLLEEEGNTTLDVRSMDLAMNMEEPVRVVIKIDTAPPETGLTPGEPFVERDGLRYATGDTPFSLQALDDTSGVRHIEYTTNGGDNWTQMSEFTLSGEDGPVLIEYRSMDIAGNLEQAIAYPVILDNQPPETSVFYNGTTMTMDNMTFVGPETLIGLDAADASSGVATVLNRTDDAPMGEYTGPFPLTGADGARTLEYHAVDQLGNTEQNRTASLFLDATPPVTTLKVGEPSWTDDEGKVWVTSATGINLTSADLLSGGNASGVGSIEYRIGNGEWTLYDAAFTLPSTQPYWNVSFRATDNVGNLETANNLTLQVDDEAPQTLLTHPAPGSLTTDQGYLDPGHGLRLPMGPDYAYATQGSQVDVIAEAEDLGMNPSGLLNVTFLLDGIVVETAHEAPYQWQWDTTGLPSGEYEIEAVATDMLGNQSTATVKVFLLPGTPIG